MTATRELFPKPSRSRPVATRCGPRSLCSLRSLRRLTGPRALALRVRRGSKLPQALARFAREDARTTRWSVEWCGPRATPAACDAHSASLRCASRPSRVVGGRPGARPPARARSTDGDMLLSNPRAGSAPEAPAAEGARPGEGQERHAPSQTVLLADSKGERALAVRRHKHRSGGSGVLASGASEGRARACSG